MTSVSSPKLYHTLETLGVYIGPDLIRNSLMHCWWNARPRTAYMRRMMLRKCESNENRNIHEGTRCYMASYE
jgi:hypothetical protein